MPAGCFHTHCHVHDARMPGVTEAAVADAPAAGVVGMIRVGCDREPSLAAIAVAANHDTVWATVGLHPHDAVKGVDSIVDLLGRDRVVAVGEAGLDYYYEHSPRDVQRVAFAAQIQLAHEHRMPLVIHSRDAWDDTFEVLAAEGVPAQTIFHCFTGGAEEARRCVELGAFVSFSGIVTFKNAAAIIFVITRRAPRTDPGRNRLAVPGAGPASGAAQPSGVGAVRRRCRGGTARDRARRPCRRDCCEHARGVPRSGSRGGFIAPPS